MSQKPKRRLLGRLIAGGALVLAVLLGRAAWFWNFDYCMNRARFHESQMYGLGAWGSARHRIEAADKFRSDLAAEYRQAALYPWKRLLIDEREPDFSSIPNDIPKGKLDMFGPPKKPKK